MWIPTEHEKYGVGKFNACIIITAVIVIFIILFLRLRSGHVWRRSAIGVLFISIFYFFCCILVRDFPELNAQQKAEFALFYPLLRLSLSV